MLEAFFDELTDGICVTDARGAVLYMNPAAKRLLGAPDPRPPEMSLCSLLCAHLAADGARECASTCELLRPGSNVEAVTFRGSFGPKEVAAWSASGVERRSVWKNLRVRCLKAPASLAGEGRHLAIIEDASADYENERWKEDWRQMIAHDLRSPLTNIYATIRILQEAKEAGAPLTDEQGGLIDAAERSCRKMVELITLYMDVAKLDAGLVELKLAPVRLADVLRAEISDQGAAARSKGLAVLLAAPEGLFVMADADLLGRVVQNVLDNAVKFTPPGGRVEITARAEGAQAALAVKDSGPGIAPEELPLLFDRYHQASARRAGKLQGTGLGLTFCREALKLMRGSIAAASSPGEGAEFSIHLPLPPAY